MRVMISEIVAALSLFTRIQLVFSFDSVQPRANTKKLLENGTISKEIVARAERLEGAHLVCYLFWTRHSYFRPLGDLLGVEWQ